MKLILQFCILLLGILGSVSAQAVEPLALYDDFNTPNIDAGKWTANQTGVPLDVAREIRGERRLRLSARAVGMILPEPPFGSVASRVRLLFANPGAVEAIRATVLVREVGAKGCTGNFTAATVARTRLSGFFFNAGIDQPTLGNSMNDVFVSAQISRRSDTSDPEGVLQVDGRIFLCINPACDQVQTLSVSPLGSMTVGQRVRLRVQWDKPRAGFIFQRDNELEVFAPYTVSHLYEPGGRSKRLEIALDPANCSVPESEAFMEVLVNNVFVNASAAPIP